MERCTSCLLCTAVCPTDALSSGATSILGLLKKLDGVENPVLGCHRFPDIKAHVKTPCLGFLTETHLLLMSIVTNGSVQLNLTSCSRCRDGQVAKVLRKTLQAYNSRSLPPLKGQIRLVDVDEELSFRPAGYNRRDFFAEIRKRVSTSATSITEELEKGGSTDYRVKRLPETLDSLHQMLPKLEDRIKKTILSAFSFSAQIDESCDVCSICVALCPTGALLANTANTETDDETSATAIAFDGPRCCGCMICVEACPQKSIDVSAGVGHTSVNNRTTVFRLTSHLEAP